MPVVFLFEEHHETAACIAENIQIGDLLRANVKVDIVGVENHPALSTPNGDPYPSSNSCNKHPEFANHFIVPIRYVYGVEETVLVGEIEADIQNGFWPKGRARTHPYNTLRSYHFLTTLFRLYREHGLNGHLFLNAGREHVEHIAELIRNGTVDAIAGHQASYIRILPASYPFA